MNKPKATKKMLTKARQSRSKLIFDGLETWLHAQLPKISGKSPLARAIRYTLIERATLNGVDPQAWLTDIIGRISDHKITRIDELMPWRYAQS